MGRLLLTAEAAECLRLAPATFLDKIQRGQVPVLRPTNLYLVTQETVDRIAERGFWPRGTFRPLKRPTGTKRPYHRKTAVAEASR